MITKYSDIVPNKDQQTILELKKKKNELLIIIKYSEYK